jgi:hypothetical protein
MLLRDVATCTCAACVLGSEASEAVGGGHCYHLVATQQHLRVGCAWPGCDQACTWRCCVASCMQLCLCNPTQDGDSRARQVCDMVG